MFPNVLCIVFLFRFPKSPGFSAFQNLCFKRSVSSLHLNEVCCWKEYSVLNAAFTVTILEVDFTFTFCIICYQAAEIIDICRILQMWVTNKIYCHWFPWIQNTLVFSTIIFIPVPRMKWCGIRPENIFCDSW